MNSDKESIIKMLLTQEKEKENKNERKMLKTIFLNKYFTAS